MMPLAIRLSVLPYEAAPHINLPTFVIHLPLG